MQQIATVIVEIRRIRPQTHTHSDASVFRSAVAHARRAVRQGQEEEKI